MKKTQVALAAFAVLVLTLLTTGAARADTWSAGAVVTYNQAEWGDQSNVAGMLLSSNYGTVYSSNLFVIGSTTPGFSILFTNEADLDDFLPASGLRDHWTRTSQILVPPQQEFSEAKWLL